ncbi:hypothetical protein ABZW49_40750 [Nonomuraea wenchangensis]
MTTFRVSEGASRGAGHDGNAICLGGPCHGLLTHVDQDIGVLAVPVPCRSPGQSETYARYRVTRERVRYHGRAEPYIALHWADPPCSCGG